MEIQIYFLSLELKIFWIVTAIYSLSLYLFLGSLFGQREDLGKSAIFALWIGAGLHTIMVLLRVVEVGRSPFQGLYESLSWFSWISVNAYLISERQWKGLHLPGVFVTSVALGASLYALLGQSPRIVPLPPALQSGWFFWHVATAFLSYSLFIVSFSIELSYILLSLFQKVAPTMEKKNLERLKITSYKLILFGFPFLTFAILSGGAWAARTYGRYWSWDPKETWSLITWGIFAIYLHSRSLKVYIRLSSLLIILGFFSMVMTFVGVNWLKDFLGLFSYHAY